MTTSPRARAEASGRRRSGSRSARRGTAGYFLVGLAVVVAAAIGTLAHQAPSSAAPSLGTQGHPLASSAAASSGTLGRPLAMVAAPSWGGIPGRDRHLALGAADGLIPDGASVFDDETPAVANLDPRLLAALRRAATDAANDGVELRVNSGWRSARYQEQLFRAAVSEYGSEEEAARWVSTPATSAHVTGDAVDVGPADATTWLSGHGARYGLCQVYRNEAWHYELRPEATSRGCPPMYADPTHDPRTQH